MKGNEVQPDSGRFYSWERGGVALICLAVLSIHLAGCTSERAYMKGGEEKKDEEVRWGVRIEGVRLASAGYMLDFRYRVIDPEKAVPLFDGKVNPYLMDQETGSRFIVPSPPKVGSLRQKVKNGPPQADKTYFIFFANPGRYVKEGEKVTVVIGGFRAENLVVQ